MEDKILDSVSNYYTTKIKEHGLTPKGVDWNGVESQELRFQQLCRIVDFENKHTLLDYGCGYGAMSDYIKRISDNIAYTGFDISDEMIRQAQLNHDDSATWTTKVDEDARFDYTIASGIFNVRLETNDEDWKKYIIEVLERMNKHSTMGFSFNMLTSYSDKEYMRDYLYYADPAFFFDYCKRNFSKYVALLHDYPVYEFTILVNKSL